MIFAALDFICRETVLHLKRERLIAIATVSTVAVLLIVLGSIVLLLVDLKTWTGWMTDQLEVYGFFAKDTTREDALKAADPISAWSEVESVTFVTKEEGWERQQRDYPSIARLDDAIDNPLPDAVQLKVRDPEQSARVAKRLEQIPEIEAVRWGGSLAQSLVRFNRVVNWTGLVVSLLVAVAGLLIVHNTVRLALHSRRREVYIMQLVGATRALVAAPFLLEGLLHGLLGAALARCLLVPTHMYLRDLAARSFVPLTPDSALLPFALYLLLAGAVLGFTGSAVSVQRYLRHKPEWHG